MKAYALNSIQRGKKASPSEVEPGQVFDVSGKEQQRLIDLGAIREATKEEIVVAKETGKLIEGTAPVKASEPASTNNTGDELAAAQAEYERLFDAKPGNMKLETLIAKIAEKKAETAASAADDLAGATQATEGGNDLSI